jgi:hypothetical protein
MLQQPGSSGGANKCKIAVRVSQTAIFASNVILKNCAGFSIYSPEVWLKLDLLYQLLIKQIAFFVGYLYVILVLKIGMSLTEFPFHFIEVFFRFY